LSNSNSNYFLEYEYVLRRSEHIAAAINTDKELIVLYSEADEASAALRGQLQFRFDWTDNDGVQITIVVHVDDLLISSASVTNLASFEQYLKSIYPQISVHHEAILDYIGITFNFTVQGKVSITMENCVSDILSDCSKSNIGSHNVQKVSPAETYFHT